MQEWTQKAQEWVNNNPTMFFTGVISIVVIIILIRIFAAIAGGNKKKALLANEDVAEISFDETLYLASRTFSSRGLVGYKIFSVNDQEPRIIGSSLIVPSGKTTIDLQYLLRNSVFAQQEISFDFEKGKTYKIEYDIMEHTYICKMK